MIDVDLTEVMIQGQKFGKVISVAVERHLGLGAKELFAFTIDVRLTMQDQMMWGKLLRGHPGDTVNAVLRYYGDETLLESVPAEDRKMVRTTLLLMEQVKWTEIALTASEWMTDSEGRHTVTLKGTIAV